MQPGGFTTAGAVDAGLQRRGRWWRLALGLGLAVAALLLLVQALVHVAVDELTDDYVQRFMRGTVELVVQDLQPLNAAERAARVRALDERFAYPVKLVPAASLSSAQRARLAQGELVVAGWTRRVYAAVPGDTQQVLQLGPLAVDANPEMAESGLHLPRELVLQLAAALGLALAVIAVAAWVLRPAWADLRALQAASQQIAQGQFDAPLPAARSRLFAPVLQASRTMLERLVGALSAQRELTGAVSHELRTPLARLRFALDALVDEDDAQRREHAVQACERDIDELEALIDASLALARLDMGALQANLQPGDLARALQAEARSLQPLLEGKRLLLNLTALDAAPALCFDAQLLPYALRNGLRNAARHAADALELSAGVDAEGQVWLTIDDDGEGIPPHLREAVFTPFKRLDRAKERGSRGFGLGLAIVRRVAQLHGGQALMESAPLGGARLRLVWPGVKSSTPSATHSP
jgi:signal transduction histidine kinase